MNINNISNISINLGDIIHDARDAKAQINREVLMEILPYVYDYLTDYPNPQKPMSASEYNRINSISHSEVKKILLESNFGQQNRYRFTDLKNISIVSDITPVILKKDIYLILPIEITKTFNDNVNPAKYINHSDLKIIDTPATYIDPASRLKETEYFIPNSGVLQIDTENGMYSQKIKVNFSSEFDSSNRSLKVKIELTDSRLKTSVNGGPPILHCRVDKSGSIIEFLSENNALKQDEFYGGKIQYFTGNQKKNNYVQNEYSSLNSSDITNKLKPGTVGLNLLLFLFVCKELGDTLQSLLLKFFFNNNQNNLVNEVQESNSCLFTSDTWCAARARINRVPVLLRNADKTLTVYSPLSEEEFIKTSINTYIENVKKNNLKILRFLKNLILKYSVTITGTNRRPINVYKKLIFENKQTSIRINYTEKIKYIFIKIYIFIYFSLYICELIYNENEKQMLNLVIVKKILSFLTATTPILSYNNSGESIYLNGLISSIFCLPKFYDSTNNNYFTDEKIKKLLDIIYNFSNGFRVDIPYEYSTISILNENTIQTFLSSINLESYGDWGLEWSKEDIKYNEGLITYFKFKSLQEGGASKRNLESAFSLVPELSFQPKRLKIKGNTNDDKIINRVEKLEYEFPDNLSYNEDDVSFRLVKFEKYNLITYSIYSILYNYLLEYPSLYSYFEENLFIIINNIFNNQDFITLEDCIKLNDIYEEKYLEFQIELSTQDESEDYRNEIVINFLNKINETVINLEIEYNREIKGGKKNGTKKYRKKKTLKKRKKYKNNKKIMNKKTKKKSLKS